MIESVTQNIIEATSCVQVSIRIPLYVQHGDLLITEPSKSAEHEELLLIFAHSYISDALINDFGFTCKD